MPASPPEIMIAPPEMILSGARIVLADRVVEGSLRVADGRIMEISGASFDAHSREDLDGDYLLPGLVELHTDNVEKHLVPRPGVIWPHPLAAAVAHDAQIISAGITTVFDALTVGEYTQGGYRRKIFNEALGAVIRAKRAGVLRADHYLHLRCEICDPALLPMLEPWRDEPLVRMVSLMDHTPGQRQFRDMDQYRAFRAGRGWSEEEIDADIAEGAARQARYGDKQRRAVLEWARERGLPVASHDDTTVIHIDEALVDGVAISEFPTTVEAAARARERGMAIVMGAPNVVRGGSHSGNVAAADLAAAGLLDALSSDYAPKSLLHAAFLLASRPGASLPQTIGHITRRPAELAGLFDRGRIAAGLRADLIQVRMVEDIPIIRRVWRGGERVL